MTPPRSAEEWASNMVVDQIHKQDECACGYMGGLLVKMCIHHKFQQIAIANALRAYAAEQVAQARAEEREACARIAYHIPDPEPTTFDTGQVWLRAISSNIAAAIRRRGEG